MHRPWGVYTNKYGNILCRLLIKLTNLSRILGLFISTAILDWNRFWLDHHSEKWTINRPCNLEAIPITIRYKSYWFNLSSAGPVCSPPFIFFTRTEHRRKGRKTAFFSSAHKTARHDMTRTGLKAM